MVANISRAARLGAGLAILIGLFTLSACSVGVGVGAHPPHHHRYHHDRYYR